MTAKAKFTRIQIGLVDPDPHWGKKLDPDPHWNHCGSTTRSTACAHQWRTLILEKEFLQPVTFEERDYKSRLQKKLGTWEILYQPTQKSKTWNFNREIQDRNCNQRLPYLTVSLSVFFSGHVLPFRNSCHPLADINLVSCRDLTMVISIRSRIRTCQYATNGFRCGSRRPKNIRMRIWIRNMSGSMKYY